MNAAKPKLIAISKKKTKTSKPKRKRGAAKMREAADKVVSRDCKPIVEALSSNCKKGQMLSAKFLYGLAKENEGAGEADGAHAMRNIATEWMNAPEWKGDQEAETPAEEEDAE